LNKTAAAIATAATPAATPTPRPTFSFDELGTPGEGTGTIAEEEIVGDPEVEPVDVPTDSVMDEVDSTILIDDEIDADGETVKVGLEEQESETLDERVSTLDGDAAGGNEDSEVVKLGESDSDLEGATLIVIDGVGDGISDGVDVEVDEFGEIVQITDSEVESIIEVEGACVATLEEMDGEDVTEGTSD